MVPQKIYSDTILINIENRFCPELLKSNAKKTLLNYWLVTALNTLTGENWEICDCIFGF